MTLSFIPSAPSSANVNTALLESQGDESTVRAHAANILRAARARGERPRVVAGSLMSKVYRISTGLLKLCL